ncbi:hypothetical protein K8R33_00995 [archaeon]|nr:hypothetical protein [archaeon]
MISLKKTLYFTGGLLLAGCTTQKSSVPNPRVTPYVNAAHQVVENLESGATDSTITHNGLTYQVVLPKKNEILRIDILGYLTDNIRDNNGIRSASLGFYKDDVTLTVQEAGRMTPSHQFTFSEKGPYMGVRTAVKDATIYDLSLFGAKTKINRIPQTLENMSELDEPHSKEFTGHTSSELFVQASLRR